MFASNKPTLPRGIEITEDGRILFYWKNLGAGIVMAVPCLLLIIFIFYDTGDDTITFIFMTLVLGFAYYGLALFFNRTEIYVEANELLIQHRPFPWKGNISVPIHEIRQIDIELEDTWMDDETGKTIEIYTLVTIYKSGKTLKPTPSIRQADQAMALKDELLRHLGIKDFDPLSRLY